MTHETMRKGEFIEVTARKYSLGARIKGHWLLSWLFHREPTSIVAGEIEYTKDGKGFRPPFEEHK